MRDPTRTAPSNKALQANNQDWNNDKDDKNTRWDDDMNQQASLAETFSFVHSCGWNTTVLLILGLIGSVGKGMVYPMLTHVFSNGLSVLAGTIANGLGQVQALTILFVAVGVFAFIMGFTKQACMDIVGHRATEKLRLAWFRSLLRQDSAFFDVHDIAGIANSIGPTSNAYRRGIGSKAGDFVQNVATGVGGLAYAAYSSWSVAVLVLGSIPFLLLSTRAIVKLNETKSARAAESYREAGTIAYSTVASIRTVLSLNAVPHVIDKYCQATEAGFRSSTKVLLQTGLANGSLLGSLMLMYVVLTLYGARLLYHGIQETGCDPSASVMGNEQCASTGAGVFGAMLAVAFAAQGIAQVGGNLEAIAGARVAAHKALQAINRKPGDPAKAIYKLPAKSPNDDSNGGSPEHGKHREAEVGSLSVQDRGDGNDDDELDQSKALLSGGTAVRSSIKAILPEYRINCLSSMGSKPQMVQGHFSFGNVSFAYPTRPSSTVLKEFSVDIDAGQTIAFVGPSGAGKSTILKLLKRFYDPTEGTIKLDGIDIKDINVKHLRSLIGYVGQEPKLFATTIAENIKSGNPDATKEDIERAARLAHAHDFIVSFPDGYQTQVGHKGTQLSGGQKQRIAIARALVANPSILLLDEATSALDSESELVVQQALATLLSFRRRTTVIVAHRLSTIRSADIIAVVMDGSIVEKGSHEELMCSSMGYYRNLWNKPNDVSKRKSFVAKENLSSTPLSPPASPIKSISVAPINCIDVSPLMSSERASNSDGGDLFAQEQQEADHGKTLIEFEDVTFSYPTRPKKKVLDRFSLRVKKGETVALVGPSGGGKSTAISLIERFYDPNFGALRYAGCDVRSLNVKWYRDQLGYVGQEPVLFNESISENIAYGAPSASHEAIERAAKLANAYDFIMALPERFDTVVGPGGAQLSGGQKQRIAIARAMVKKPGVLVLDEATSTLDNESENVVQDALDSLIKAENCTCIVIAHRLTTIRNADKIGFVADGQVQEFGTHEELMAIENGLYKRLVNAQRRDSRLADIGTGLESPGDDDEDTDEGHDLELLSNDDEESAFDVTRARQMAIPDSLYVIIGWFGAVLAGGVFPMWGLLFGKTIGFLFRRVEVCGDGVVPAGFESCDDYWFDSADQMRLQSHELSIQWLILAFVNLIGNVISFWCFGTASERLCKRVRDAAFKSLVRQEVAYFDKRNVGMISSQLQEDAARIQAFSGEPIRIVSVACASVCIGVALSFVYMRPFAFLAILCIPPLAIVALMDGSRQIGIDNDPNREDELNTPNGIVIETLMNMEAVSALTLEQERLAAYQAAVEKVEKSHVKDAIASGVVNGSSLCLQRWIQGLFLFWSAWLVFHYPELYSFEGALICNFALIYSLFGLIVLKDLADRKKTMECVGRIFYLLDRQSSIDPLSDEGKLLYEGTSWASSCITGLDDGIMDIQQEGKVLRRRSSAMMQPTAKSRIRERLSMVGPSNNWRVQMV